MPRVLPCLLLLFPTLAAAGAEADAPVRLVQAGGVGIVWCHDAARGLVSRKRAEACDGAVVSEEQARAIRASRTRQIQDKLRPADSPFPGKKLAGRGTGFFVSARGHVVTNHHVVAECGGLTVTPSEGSPAVATVLASDRGNDLSLLAAPLAPPEFGAFRGAAKPTPGEEVLVVGYPLHGMVAIRPILVSGRVIEPTLPMPAARFPMRIDIRQGNSGSPVLDRAGRVIGVISSKINTPALYATTGQVVRDLGIAVGVAPVFDLLRNNAVEITAVPEAGARDGDELHEHARRIVAQIACWR